MNSKNRGRKITQINDIENIFKNIREENFVNLKNEVPVKIEEVCRIANGLDQKITLHDT